MWPEDIRNHHEPGEMSTDDLVASYGLAGRLRKFEHAASLDGPLRGWMFEARKELEGRGQLELIREWLPVFYDPTMREPLFGPGAALAGNRPFEKQVPPSPRALKSAG